MVQDIKQRLDNMNQTIEASQLNIRRVIETVNENYLNFISANIAYHIQLKDVAEQDGNLSAMMHHQVMSEIYQSILERSYRGSPLQ